MTALMISVVTAVRTNTADVPTLLNCLASQDLPATQFEVIVVDNGRVPTVATPPPVEGGPRTTVVHEPAVGLSKARNTGIRQARAGIIAITDPDSQPDRKWLSELVAAFADQDVVCVGGRVNSRLSVGSCRVKPSVLELLLPGQWPLHTAPLRRPYWIIGCNLAFRRGDSPMLFAENLGRIGRRRRACEDLELVIRAQALGAVVIAPDAVVHRTIRPEDLRLRSLVARAWWHGISIARLRKMHPDADIYDSFRLRDLSVRQPSLTALCRIAGYRAERLRNVRHARHDSKETGT